MAMSWFAMIILGGIAGWLASIVMRTNAQMGLIANIIVGVIGSLIGGFVFRMLGGHGVTGLNLYSLGVSTVGAVILLWIAKMVRK